jgi:hypothetical protein
MADDSTEPMGIDEQAPEVTDVTETTEKQTDIDGLISMLNDADVTTTEELEGKLVASQQVGNLAYQLGETRKELAELKKQPAPAPPREQFESHEPGTVDIETALEGAVEKVLSKREKMAQKAQQQQMLTWSKIQSHPYYPKVKDIFQDKMQNPEMITRIQAGETDTITEFFNTVIDFQGGVIQKAAGAIKTWKTDGGAAPATPQVESGDARVSAQTPEAKADKDKTIDGFKVKVDSGSFLTDTEEMEALDAILKPD